MRRSLSVLPLALMVLTGSAGAQTVIYQGFMTNTRNDPVTGSYTLKATLFDAPTGGTQQWTETVTATVVNGNFAVELGAADLGDRCTRGCPATSRPGPGSSKLPRFLLQTDGAAHPRTA
jgi:hypothetical protein